MTVGPFGFPVEHLLTEPLPEYERERLGVAIKLIATFVFFIVILPTMMATPVAESKDSAESSSMKESSSSSKSKSTSTSKTNGKSSKRHKKNKEQPTSNEKEQEKETPKQNVEETIVVEVNPLTSFISVIGCMVFMTLVLIQHSPDNYYTPNAVFQAPMLTKDDCHEILQMADTAAASNYENAKSVHAMYDLMMGAAAGGGGEIMEANDTVKGLLEDPPGWNKARHKAYPTTDLNLVTDPFTKEDREWIQQKMDARLSPIIQRIYGVPPSAVRATDVSQSCLFMYLWTVVVCLFRFWTD
jgi:chemotaxis protein histidine kinase CheA